MYPGPEGRKSENFARWENGCSVSQKRGASKARVLAEFCRGMEKLEDFKKNVIPIV